MRTHGPCAIHRAVWRNTVRTARAPRALHE